MIVFEFYHETHEDGIKYERTVYHLGFTSCVNEDEKHVTEIFEQLDAQTAGLA